MSTPGFTLIDSSGTPGFTPIAPSGPASTPDPYGFSTTGTGGGPEAEMLRRHARSRAGKDYTPESGVVPWLGRQAGGALDATGELAAAIPGLIKTLSSFFPTMNPSAMLSEQEQPTTHADVQGVVGPQLEQWQKGAQTTGLESAGHRAAAFLPFAGPMAGTAGESLGRGEVGRGLVQAIAAIEGGRGLAKPMGGAQITGTGLVREVMGEGGSKARLLADQHAHALATKQHLAGVAEAVHTDAQTSMSQVLAKVDAAKPEGAFNKADIQSKVSDAMGDLVKVPEKMPSSVTKILAKDKGATGWEAAAQSNTARFIKQLRDQGLNDTRLKQVLTKEGLSAADIDSAMSNPGALTAEQLKQMRSDVGQELSRYGKKGVTGAALNKVYGVLSTELRNAAKDAGVESDWLDANNKYTQYANDFLRGPLKRSLFGSTASSIMEPLTGSTRLQIRDTLQKYRDAGFNVDTDTLGEEMRRYGMAKTINRLSQPGKLDLLMAGFAPKALALRQLGPWMARRPGVLDRFAGEGFETTVPTRQVYPTKAAAMKANKGGSYKPSEKAATMSAAPRKLGPEFEAQERETQIARYKEILRNPRATANDVTEARNRLKELGAVGQ